MYYLHNGARVGNSSHRRFNFSVSSTVPTRKHSYKFGDAQVGIMAPATKRGALKTKPEPTTKKPKIATNVHSSPSILSPAAHSPMSHEGAQTLPVALSDNRSLPTVPKRQSIPLPEGEYQTIATSAVLQTSLDRSRLQWVYSGIFERYWVKPETGRNARPPPPNNPEPKWQVKQGPCRIRIEPHVFEAEVFLEEKNKALPQSKKQQVGPSQRQQVSAPGPLHKQHQFQQQSYGGSHAPLHAHPTLPPVQLPSHHTVITARQAPGSPLSISGHPSGPTAFASRSTSQSVQQEKRSSPDPVISMLASRASSDLKLKALMKEVATGNATQDQLKIFQGHIDELTKLNADRKMRDEDSAKPEPAKKELEAIQYDGASDQRPAQAPPHQTCQQHQSSPLPHQQPLSTAQQQAWQSPAPRSPQPHLPHATTGPPTPPPTAPPVILAFSTPGATDDRFLFPCLSILEMLSPQHLLASFIVSRKGSAAVDPTDLDPETEYWQPVTLMIEVAYGREEIIRHVVNWVKPAEEVRAAMREIMERCTRAPQHFLALQLPVQGSKRPGTASEAALDAPSAKVIDKPRSNVKYIKKAKSAEAPKSGNQTASGPSTADKNCVEKPPKHPPIGTTAEAPDVNSAEQAENVAEACTDQTVTAATERTRPKRAVRKSVRISDV